MAKNVTIGEKVIYHYQQWSMDQGDLNPSYYPEQVEAIVIDIKQEKEEALIELPSKSRKWVLFSDLRHIKPK